MAIAAMLLLGACSPSGSDQEQQLKQARVAAATAQMALDVWLSGDVPGHYARDTIEAMRQQLEAAGRAIEQAGSQSSARQAMVLQPIRQTGEAMDQAMTAIGASDHAAAAKSGEAARTAAAVLSLPASAGAAASP